MKSVRRALSLVFGLAVSLAPVVRAAEPPVSATPSAHSASAPTAPAAAESVPAAGATAGLNPGKGRVAPRDPAEVAADALVARPVGFAATVLGAAIFVVALPVAAISGDVKETGRALVGAPARWTFDRPLGQMSGL